MKRRRTRPKWTHKPRSLSICIKRFSASIVEWFDLQNYLVPRHRHHPPVVQMATRKVTAQPVFDCNRHVPSRPVQSVDGNRPRGFGEDSILDNERSIYFCHFIIARRSKSFPVPVPPSTVFGDRRGISWGAHFPLLWPKVNFSQELLLETKQAREKTFQSFGKHGAELFL